MTIISKAAISLATFGTIGGLSAYAGGLFNIKKNENKTTYKDRLKAEGFDLNIDSAGWGQILIEYNKKKDILKTFKVKGDDSDNEEGLKQKCKEFWSKDEINEADYKKLKQWCVKKEGISAILGKEGKKFKFLKKEENSHWIKKLVLWIMIQQLLVH